jgi:hypothetical protein
LSTCTEGQQLKKEVYTFYCAGINEEKDRMGGPCGKHGTEKKKIRREVSSEMLNERDCLKYLDVNGG